MKEINRFQRLLLESYPNIDLMPFDPSDHVEVDTMVRNHMTGDTLFDFLWMEMANHGDEGPLRIIKAMDMAIAEIQKVSDHISNHDADAMLETLRREQADKAFEVYDFGDAKVVASDGWERLSPGREWSRVVYFENDEDPRADSVKGHFVLTFAGDTASVVENAVGILVGVEVGSWKSAWMKNPTQTIHTRRVRKLEAARDQAAERKLDLPALLAIKEAPSAGFRISPSWIRDRESNEWHRPFEYVNRVKVEQFGSLVVRFTGDDTAEVASARVFVGSELKRRNEIIAERKAELGYLYSRCRFDHDVMAYGEWGRKDDLDTWQLDIRFLDHGRWSKPGRVIVKFMADGSLTIESIEAFLGDTPIRTGIEPKTASFSPGM